ncbi:1-deoxy-D-xylulose-5-phosphate reductoisomerase [Candidatus Omnitrophota bacterium]
MKRIAIIGSTGSIGKNTLEVITALSGEFEVYALAICKNTDLLKEQMATHHPKKICVWDNAAAAELKSKALPSELTILSGKDGLLALVEDPLIDIYMFALSGSNGIEPLLAAIQKGKRIAIANKEPLVIAGGLIRDLAKKHNTEIIPVDSEHSAIFQCLQGHTLDEVDQLIITASGGPFFSKPRNSFKDITPEDALRHPKWDMGQKITIDSATMMNKALELIEATTLFGIDYTKIKILVHPEALIHSMVQFIDGSLLAQISLADMRLPIQYALTYPKRVEGGLQRVSFEEMKELHFFVPDQDKFPTIALGYWAARVGGTLPAVLNAVDEICVEYFLEGKISFVEIMEFTEKVMTRHKVINEPKYSDIIATDGWAREEARRLCLM